MAIRYYLVFFASMFIALCFETVPVDGVWAVAWPQWTCLFLVYWFMTAPRFFGAISAFIIGFLLDVLSVNTIGIHLVSLLSLGLLTHVLQVRLKSLNLLTQSIFIGVLVGIALLVQRTLLGLLEHVTESLWYYLPSISSAIAWPLVKSSLMMLNRFLGQHFINSRFHHLKRHHRL